MENVNQNKFPKINLPPIGFRIIKTGIAVFLCYLVSVFRGEQGYVFYSQIAAIWCMQTYMRNSKHMAIIRFVGTVIGAIFGLFVIVVTNSETIIIKSYNDLLHVLFISVIVMLIIYTTVIIKQPKAAFFSCVVFLSIVVIHLGDQNPYLFVWNRFLDTVIGIIIGVSVNYFRFPRHKKREILFVSGIDDSFEVHNIHFTSYGRVELNRMLDDGLKFTISTKLTPASLLEVLNDINISIPIIAMDGAVLFDIKEKKYIKTYIISKNRAKELYTIMKEYQVNIFTNIIIDDTLLIYYNESIDKTYNEFIKEKEKSLYRNYIQREMPENEDIVYFMILDSTKKVNELYDVLCELKYHEQLKIIKYESKTYDGYSFLRIYNKNASEKNMITYLKDFLRMEQSMVLGRVKNECDFTLEDIKNNQMVKTIKRNFEPTRFPFKKKTKK